MKNRTTPSKVVNNPSKPRTAQNQQSKNIVIRINKRNGVTIKGPAETLGKPTSNLINCLGGAVLVGVVMWGTSKIIEVTHKGKSDNEAA